MTSLPTVAVMGLGYIGLPTAVVLAQQGVQVFGFDVSESRVAMISRGELPFVEAGLEDALRAVVATGKLKVNTKVPQADTYIIAVPTPFAAEHKADLSFIDSATDAIIPVLRGGELLVLESTSPVGTTEHMADRVLAARPELRGSLEFAHCPERVLPGRIMEEMVSNDRIIGGITQHAAERARDLYGLFCDGQLHLTDARTVEMAKLTENAFRDVNIAFANELSLICDEKGIDVWELIELANKHPRVNILQPGPGVGGHCIAVDPWFIVSSSPEKAKLINTARLVNDGKPAWVIEQVRKLAQKPKPSIAARGLAFKKNIDDLRESPALHIVKELASTIPDGHILAVEPNIPTLPAELKQFNNVELSTVDRAIESADVVLLLVDHDDFRRISLADLEGKGVLDTRGMLDLRNAK